MVKNSLQTFVEGVRAAWRPLGAIGVAECQRRLERLLQAPVREPWLAELLRGLAPSRASLPLRWT